MKSTEVSAAAFLKILLLQQRNRMHSVSNANGSVPVTRHFIL